MGCERLDARYEDHPALVWGSREERNELVGEQVMAKDIGCEDFPKRRFVLFVAIAFNIGIPRACLSSSRLAGSTQLVRRVGERGEEVSQCFLDSHWPVNACESTISRITNNGIKAWEVFEKSG